MNSLNFLSGLSFVLLSAFNHSLAAQGIDRLVHEALIPAPVEQVWNAFTTKAGLEPWMAAHAEVDLSVGGKMRTHHDPDGRIGDAKTIENTILSFEPLRMFSFKVSKAPEGFPFPNAIRSMWTVVYFESVDAKTTRVREVSLGFGDDVEAKKMREFFDVGNAYTMQMLKKRFAPPSPTGK
jgi:uncharacterized protein YndB with AHSA1/START domain